MRGLIQSAEDLNRMERMSEGISLTMPAKTSVLRTGMKNQLLLGLEPLSFQTKIKPLAYLVLRLLNMN